VTAGGDIHLGRGVEQAGYRLADAAVLVRRGGLPGAVVALAFGREGEGALFEPDAHRVGAVRVLGVRRHPHRDGEGLGLVRGGEGRGRGFAGVGDLARVGVGRAGVGLRREIGRLFSAAREEDAEQARDDGGSHGDTLTAWPGGSTGARGSGHRGVLVQTVTQSI
jgi:hypothetical protein